MKRTYVTGSDENRIKEPRILLGILINHNDLPFNLRKIQMRLSRQIFTQCEGERCGDDRDHIFTCMEVLESNECNFVQKIR